MTLRSTTGEVIRTIRRDVRTKVELHCYKVRDPDEVIEKMIQKYRRLEGDLLDPDAAEIIFQWVLDANSASLDELFHYSGFRKELIKSFDDDVTEDPRFQYLGRLVADAKNSDRDDLLKAILLLGVAGATVPQASRMARVPEEHCYQILTQILKEKNS